MTQPRATLHARCETFAFPTGPFANAVFLETWMDFALESREPFLGFVQLPGKRNGKKGIETDGRIRVPEDIA